MIRIGRYLHEITCAALPNVALLYILLIALTQ